MERLPDIIPVQPDIHGSGIDAFWYAWDGANFLKVQAKERQDQAESFSEKLIIEF